MTAGDALVAEVAVEFKDLGEATYEQALEKELRRDTQGKVHAEGIVVSLEGAGGSTTGNTLKHGGLDFEVVTLVEEAADLCDHA